MGKKRTIYVMALTFVCLIFAVVAVMAQSQRNGGSTITVYSANGSAIKEWKIPGRVEFKDGMFSFVDAKTDHLVEVSGTVVVMTAP